MATATSLAASASNRTAYVSRLRRAFLLRAHPDRFRSHSQSLRKGQAKLIQALSERLVASDFIAYTSSRELSPTEPTNQTVKTWETHAYYLEGKDGSLNQYNLSLNQTAGDVLTSMCQALQSSGLSNIPLPPSPPQHDPSSQDRASLELLDRLSKGNNASMWKGLHHFQQNGGNFNPSSSSSGIDRSFDVNTKKGKDLMGFLQSLNKNDIAQRKADRIDASAAALVARQAYKFQAIDGTGLGWSSRSLAQCLTSLTNAHDEHHTKFQVESFYPLRLILRNDESPLHKLDVFGGTIRLNPGSTQSQWLETLLLVTEESLEVLGETRDALQTYLARVQNSLNVQIRKGHSCSSREYHLLLQHLSCAMVVDCGEVEDGASSKALAMDRITIVVETAQSCRQPLVTNEGHVRVSAGMLLSTIIFAASDCRAEAVQKMREEEEKQEKSKELIALVKLELGLSHVYKGRLLTITSDRFLGCLESLLSMDRTVRDDLREYTEGQMLGITGEGRSCHLGDDGSIIIPWDWNRTP